MQVNNNCASSAVAVSSAVYDKNSGIVSIAESQSMHVFTYLYLPN